MSMRLTCAIVVGAALASSCAPHYAVPVDRAIQPTVDVAPFQRVFVAGFVAGGSTEIDASVETVQLLRSELRSQSRLAVIDSDPIALTDADVVSDVEYWRSIGEERQAPLIVTGTATFQPVMRSRTALQVAGLASPSLRRRELPTRVYLQQQGYQLRLTLVCIDGRTGALLRSDTMQEEILYGADQHASALSGYFDLMNRVLPNALAALTDSRVLGTRVLLK